VLRLVLLAAFFRYRVTHPARGAPRLWLAALVCELWLAVAWLVAQLPKLSPTNRETHLDRLASRYDDRDGEGGEPSRLGSVDVFVTAAGAGSEPPLAAANTVLSVLAADYPAGRLACYVSDDGADMLLFEALFQAAGFARRWVPFCRRHAVEPRAPELYFARGVDYLRDRAAPSFVKERRAMKVIDHGPRIDQQKRLGQLIVICCVAEGVRGVEGEDELPRREGAEGAGGRVGHAGRHAVAREQHERPSCHDTGQRKTTLCTSSQRASETSDGV
jgi:cellulose synthase A